MKSWPLNLLKLFCKSFWISVEEIRRIVISHVTGGGVMLHFHHCCIPVSVMMLQNEGPEN